MLLILACTPAPPEETAAPEDTGSAGETGDTGEAAWGAEALAFVTERLVGAFSGAWQLYGLDGDDQQTPTYAWTDVITGSNPRIEEDRALVDILDEMDGGNWTDTVSFFEGVYLTKEGGVGDYFFEIDGVVTIATEVSPDHWEYTTELGSYDLQSMENVDADNLVAGWKHTTKLVSWVEGWERHDVAVVTHVEYVGESDGTLSQDFTSLEGYHQKYE
jgi:hypothetical protein